MSEQEEIITLTDDEGNEHEFVLIDVLKVEDIDYAILLPADEESEEGIILKIIEGEDGGELLVEIDDDEEWEKVAALWNEMSDDEDEEE